jgi:aldehyde:ferredoxin oxidoreductase
VPPAVPRDLVEKYFPDLGTFGPGTDERGLEGWGRGLKHFEDFNAAVNASGLCIFPNSISVGPRNLKDFPEKIARLISSLTGMELDGNGFLRAGERIFNLQKAFNSREGLSVRDDDYSSAKALQDLPHMAKQYPDRVPIDEYYRDREALLCEYYVARGWNPETGLQLQETLAELDLEEVTDELERYSALGRRSHVTREGE